MSNEVIEKGQIPINDISLFMKFLQRFVPTDDVTVSLVENKVVIERLSPKKVARMITSSPENIVAAQGTEALTKFHKEENIWVSDKYICNLRIDFEAEDMQSIIADGDLIKQRVYPFVIKDGKFSVPLVSKEFGEMETEVPTEDITLPDSTRTAYAAGLDNLFSALQGKVSLFMKAGGNHPLLLEHSAEKYHFVAMLAPRMEDEE